MLARPEQVLCIVLCIVASVFAATARAADLTTETWDCWDEGPRVEPREGSLGPNPQRYQVQGDLLIANGWFSSQILENDDHGLVAASPFFRMNVPFGPSIGAVAILINKETGYYFALSAILPDRANAAEQEPVTIQVAGVCERVN